MDRFFRGQPVEGTDVPDIGWFRPDGQEMTEADWEVSFAKALAVFLNGKAIRDLGPYGEHPSDDSFLVTLNAGFEPIEFALPGGRYGSLWSSSLSTGSNPQSISLPGGFSSRAEDHSLQVLTVVE